MKNRKKNKYIVYGVIALSTLSLVGVGFAAWEINGSLDDKTSVTVSVGDLTNKTLIVEIQDTSDLNIAFDNVENGGANISNGGGGKEDLSFTVNFRLESSRTINDADTFKITASFDSESESIRKYQQLDTDNYIVADCLTNFSFNLPAASGSLTTNNDYITGSITYDTDFKGALVSLTYNFAWGSKFNGKNPGLWEGNILTIGERLEDFTAKAKGLLPIDLTITPSYIKEQGNNE